MKVILVGTECKDFPKVNDKPKFEEEVKDEARKGLKLNPEDEVQLNFHYQ